jgi:hypothetical protein
MANPAAVIALDVDGTDLQQDPIGIFLQIIAGGPYETSLVRGEDITVPSLEGQVPLSRVGHERKIVLRGYVAGTGTDEQDQRIDFEELALSLVELFDPRTIVTMTAELPSGAVATITCRPQAPMLWDEVVPSMSRLQVEFLSTDPDWVITPAGS